MVFTSLSSRCRLQDRPTFGAPGRSAPRSLRRRRAAGCEPDLAGDEDEAPRLDRLVVGRALERAGAFSVRTISFSATAPPRAVVCDVARAVAWASAAPSALKMASRTCWESSPSISRTWSVTPAACANASRKLAARSLRSPPARASVRSTLLATSGRSETSSATWASASSAGTKAEPCPHAASARSRPANASPSSVPASATSASASPGGSSSTRSKRPLAARRVSRWSSTGIPVATLVGHPSRRGRSCVRGYAFYASTRSMCAPRLRRRSSIRS